MNFQQLRFAVEVDRHKSISRAAKALYVSQPRVSIAIRELEEELKTQLFERTPTGVETTEVGRAFIRDAMELLGQADSLGQRYSGDRNKLHTLRVAGPPADSSNEALTRIVSVFESQTESYKISYLNQRTFEAIDSAERGMVDISIISFRSPLGNIIQTITEQKNLEFHLIAQYPLSLAVAKDHPLAKATEVRLEDILQYPILNFDNELDEDTKKVVAMTMQQEPGEEKTPIKSIQVTDMYTLTKLMLETPAISIFTAWSTDIHTLLGREIVRLPGTLGGMNESRGWVKRKEATLSPYAASFIRYVEDYFKEHIRDNT